MTLPSVILTAVLLAAPVTAVAQSPGPAAPDYLAQGHRYAAWFLEGQLDSLAAHTDSAHRITAAQFAERRALLSRIAGHETAMMDEQMNWRLGHRQYWRESLFSQMDEPMVIRFLLDDQGRIVGFGMGPRSRTPEPDAGPPAGNDSTSKPG